MLRVMKTFWLYLTGIWLYLTGKPHRDGQFARQIPSLSEMAESSSSAAANSDHDVFINHRGPDAKKNFGSHLHRSLRSHGLRVFLDQPELQRGDDFSVQIEHAIRSASVHVAIFSQGYADSTWCLDELLQMLNTKAPIIPVFYHVKPDELRGTRGKKRTYAEALDDLASKTDYDGQTPRHDPSKIQKWREALRQVANISGFELEACNGDEGELLEKVVVEVLERVKKPALLRDVGKYPTGLDEKAEDFGIFLLRQQQRGKHQILGIMGLGGIGKTTLATELFNRKTSYYSRSCFLSDVKDKKGNDLISLQKEILEILDVPDDKIKRVKNVAEGKVVIRNHLSSSKALVIIDDVDDEDQVDALLPHQSVIHPDSLILITSRNRQVLINSNVEEESIYTLTGLSEKHSLELFCSHSFNQPYPPQEFESLVEKFVEACSGLPLSLKVIGALLKRKNKSYWEDLLNKLGRTLPGEIKQKLQISYNALEEEEKEIFLDIACFFIGEDRDRVIRIVGESGFQNIVDRSLVDVDREKRIKMHDHVRDLGRELAEGSGLPGRLWRWTEEDNGDLLRKSRNGQMTDVRGVRIHGGEYTQVDDGIRMSSLQFLDAKGDLMERILTKVSSPNLKWLRWMYCDSSFLPSSVSMKNLRVLQIEGLSLKTLWEEELEPPLQLRELEIKCRLSHIPNSIGRLKHLERIVICSPDHSEVTITELPEEFCRLRSLKVLVLEGWSSLKALPNWFGNLIELQHIQLSSCTALDSLPESFGNLTELQHLRLFNCSALKRLPESFDKLSNLQHINLSRCSALERLPGSFGKLIKLQHLDLGRCYELSLQRETLGNISTLKYIDLSYCGKIEVLPSQVAHQRSLEQLRLRGTNLKELPSAIGQLSCMEVLELGEDPLLDKLPFQLYDLKKLKELTIEGWQELKVLPDALCDLKNLKKLTISDCKKLKCLPPLLGDLSNLNGLYIQDCDELNGLPTSIGRLTQLTHFWVCGCPLIRELPLKEEVVRGKRGTLNDFQILPRLKLLQVSETGISEVSFAERVCCNLQRLFIQGCNNVVEVEVGKFPNTLIYLSFSGSVKLKNIRGLGQLKKLQELNIRGCSDLEEVEGIQNCICLSELIASGCVKLKNIRGLGQLKNLLRLEIEGCSDLEEVEGIQDCRSLGRINATGCPKLQLDAGVKEQLRQRCWRAKF